MGVIGSALQAAMSKREAERNRNFQAKQSGSVHQRNVKDLEKAGLSKILAYGSQGSAASGSQASFNPDIDAPKLVKTGLEASKVKAETQLTRQLIATSTALEASHIQTAEGIRLDNIVKGPKASIFEQGTQILKDIPNMVNTNAQNVISTGLQAGKYTMKETLAIKEALRKRMAADKAKWRNRK